MAGKLASFTRCRVGIISRTLLRVPWEFLPLNYVNSQWEPLKLCSQPAVNVGGWQRWHKGNVGLTPTGKLRRRPVFISRPVTYWEQANEAFCLVHHKLHHTRFDWWQIMRKDNLLGLQEHRLYGDVFPRFSINTANASRGIIFSMVFSLIRQEQKKSLKREMCLKEKQLTSECGI